MIVQLYLKEITHFLSRVGGLRERVVHCGYFCLEFSERFALGTYVSWVFFFFFYSFTVSIRIFH